MLHKITAEFTPPMTSGHYRFAFTIAQPCSGITIKYKYAPKPLQDTALATQLIQECYTRYGIQATSDDITKELPLNNHITLSLDSPQGLVGTAHRHDNDTQFTISPIQASAGFNNVPITAGEWAIVLSTHAVLSSQVLAEVEVYEH